MVYEAPDHYIYDFKFDIEQLPAMKKDKLPSRLAVPGVLFGFMLAAMGILELVMYFLNPVPADFDFNLPNQVSYADLQTQRFTFDGIVILMGIAVIFLSVAAMMRYKKIYFDGTNVKIEHKPLLGHIREEKEHLYNYLGVLLKVEYYQLGLINRNRYIIELYHKDKNKRVPLYMSTGGKNIRKIWEYYSRKLRMPALFMTDHGLVSRNHNELNKTLKDMSKKWHLKTLYRSNEDVPLSVRCVDKKNKVIIKERRLFFDVYSILAVFGVALLTALLGYAFANLNVILQYVPQWQFGIFAAVCLAIIIFSLLGIFCKDVLVISEEDVILGHNVPFLRIDTEMLPKNKIEAVDIGHNPTTDRYYLSIISHDKTMIFGKNMPMEDLRWVRGFVIREVVK